MNLAEANKLREAIATLRHKVEVLENRVSVLEYVPGLSARDEFPTFHVEHEPTVIAKRPVGRPRKN